MIQWMGGHVYTSGINPYLPKANQSMNNPLYILHIRTSYTFTPQLGHFHAALEQTKANQLIEIWGMSCTIGRLLLALAVVIPA